MSEASPQSTEPPAPKVKLPAMTWNQQHGEAAASKLTDRVSIWILIGNATGLLLCFNAALDHKVCNWAAFRITAIEFGVGAAAILIATILTIFSYSWRGGIETMRAINQELTGAEAQKAGCALNLFSLVLTMALVIAIAGYVAGFVTLIHAPLRFLLDASATSMLCPS